MMDGYMVAIIGFVAFYILSAKFWKSRRKAILINKIPGPKPYPILGNLTMFLVPREEILPVLNEAHTRYGDIFRTWHGSRPVIHLSAPEHIELILGAHNHTRKGKAYSFLRPWLAESILMSSGQKWFKQRKLISPTFHFKVLQSFLDVFNECSQILVKKLNAKADGTYFNVSPFITKFALDNICETAMGTRIQAQENEESLFVTATLEASKSITERQFTVYLHPDFIYFNTKQGKAFLKAVKTLHDFTQKVIQERKIFWSENKKSDEHDDNFGEKKKLAFLDLLLKSSDGELTDSEIRAEVDTFMFAGHDTTNAAIGWALILLGNYPQIQNDIREELENIFQGEDRPVNLQDLGNMKLMERAIKESLRLFPSVPMITRLVDSDISVGKHVIPADTDIIINFFNLHRHPELFPDPLKFDPDRFLPENCLNRHAYAFIPFSAGQRNCIGQKYAMYEEKVALATILRRFEVTSLQKPSEIKIVSDIVSHPKDGILIKLKPIEKL